MKNKYFVNIILCENVEENFSEIIHPFNNLEIQKGEKISFEIVLSLEYEIETDTNTTMIFGIRHKKFFKPLRVMNRRFGIGIGSEYASFHVKEFEDIGEGWYTFEVRAAEDADFDFNELNKNKLIEILDKTEVLNQYRFRLEHKENGD